VLSPISSISAGVPVTSGSASQGSVARCAVGHPLTFGIVDGHVQFPNEVAEAIRTQYEAISEAL